MVTVSFVKLYGAASHDEYVAVMFASQLIMHLNLLLTVEVFFGS